MTTIPVNQTDLAVMLGLSKSTVSLQVKRGMPVDSLEAAQAWRQQNIDPARKKGKRYDQHRQETPHQVSQPRGHQPTGNESDESFDSARTREKIAAANLAEMEEAALNGKYLVKADYERYTYNAGRMLRDQLTNCSRRIGAEVAGLTSADDCEAVIYREHRLFLSDFARQLRETLDIEIENNPLNIPSVASPAVTPSP
jgi:hypothetical protein